MTAQSENWFEIESADRGTHRLGVSQSEIWLEQYVYSEKPMPDGEETINLSVSIITDAIMVPDSLDPSIADELAAHLSTEDLSVPLSRLDSGGAGALAGMHVDVPGEGKADLGFYDSPGFLATPILSELTRLSVTFNHLDRNRYDVTAKGESEAGESFLVRTVTPLKGVILQVGTKIEKSTVEAYFAHAFDASSMDATWKEPGFRWDWALEARFRDDVRGRSE